MLISYDTIELVSKITVNFFECVLGHSLQE